MILFKKKDTFSISLYSDIYGPISFRLGLMIGTTKLYVLISVWMALTVIKGHRYKRNKKNFGVHFVRNFTVDMDEI